MVYRISRGIVRFLLRTVFRFRVQGAEHEPPTGPLVIVSNHASDLDPLVVGATLRRRVHFMAKVELFRSPLVRWWATACGAFPVRRGEADRQAWRTARAILERGGALVMFPEGTRGASARDLRPAEPGAALLALRTGATILPMAIVGTDAVLPRGAHRLSRAAIAVRVGVPIHPNGTARVPVHSAVDRGQIDAVGRRFMQVIADLLHETEQA